MLLVHLQTTYCICVRISLNLTWNVHHSRDNHAIQISALFLSFFCTTEGCKLRIGSHVKPVLNCRLLLFFPACAKCKQCLYSRYMHSGLSEPMHTVNPNMTTRAMCTICNVLISTKGDYAVEMPEHLS